MMKKSKKTYTKPRLTIHPAGSPMYNKIKASLVAEVKEKQADYPASNKD